MLPFIMCIFVPYPMQIFTSLAVVPSREIREGRRFEMCVIYRPLFRRKWASYSSDCNKRWAARLKPASKPLCLLFSERDGAGRGAGAEPYARVFWGIPLPSRNRCVVSQISVFTDAEMQVWMSAVWSDCCYFAQSLTIKICFDGLIGSTVQIF